MNQHVLTPAMGKRLIAKALAADPSVMEAARTRTLVIIAGTTNGYVAEEVLGALGQTEGFSAKQFFRGITLPSSKPVTGTGRLADVSSFPGDVVIRKGTWEQGKTVLDVVDDMKEGDIILKGANALDLTNRRAGILIGHPRAGTIGAALPAVLGRKVRLILPVGLEKRIPGDLDRIAERMNRHGTSGSRFWPVPGEVITELEAISMLTGASAELVSAGGVGGAEGCVWLLVDGEKDQLAAASEVIRSVQKEPAFSV